MFVRDLLMVVQPHYYCCIGLHVLEAMYFLVPADIFILLFWAFWWAGVFIVRENFYTMLKFENLGIGRVVEVNDLLNFGISLYDES